MFRSVCARILTVAGLVLFGLAADAQADSFVVGSIQNPGFLQVGERTWGSLHAHPSSPEEPLTPGSGSGCGGESGWTMESPEWYYFVGTGEKVVVRVDGDVFFGMAVYDGYASPTADELLYCKQWTPRRYELETQPGRVYRIQVGVWGGPLDDSTQRSYRVSVFPKTLNAERDDALPLQPTGTARIGNWGAPYNPASTPCVVHETVKYLPDRSGWGKVVLPRLGTLRVDMEPEASDYFESWMILLYEEGNDQPIDCTLEST